MRCRAHFPVAAFHPIAWAVLIAFPLAGAAADQPDKSTPELDNAPLLLRTTNSLARAPSVAKTGSQPRVQPVPNAPPNPLESALLRFARALGMPRPVPPTLRPPSQPIALNTVTLGPSPGISANGAATAIPGNNDGQREVESEPMLGWSIPPIRWGGQINTNASKTQSDLSASTSNAQVFSIQGASYIYQPWYAQVSGNIDIFTSTSTSANGDSEGNGARSIGASFGANLGLFPVSRFPMQATVQHNDSRATSNDTGTQFTASRLGLTQSWRPEAGNESITGGFDHSVLTTKEFSSVVSALRGSYNNSIPDHNFSGTANFSSSRGDAGGQHSSLLSVNGNHQWRDPEEEYTVASFANLSNVEVGLLRANTLDKLSSQFLQLGTSVTWLPFEDLPITINGGANVMGSNTTSAGESVKFAGFSGYANTSYLFTRNLSASGGVNVQHTQNAAQGITSLGAIGSASYAGDPLSFGEFAYSWGVGLGLGSQVTSSGLQSTNLSSSAQHSLSRTLSANENRMISVNASQSASVFYGSGSGGGAINARGTSLSHSAGISWMERVGASSSGSASAMVFDSVSAGAAQSHFRNLSLQGSLQSQLSRNSSLSVNLSMNASQQLGSTTEKPNDNPIWTGVGGASYSHRNPFSISNLVYSANLQVNSYQANQRVLTGDPNAMSWQTGTTFQQSVDYRLGRLKFRGTNTINEINGKKNMSIYGTVSRGFGQY